MKDEVVTTRVKPVPIAEVKFTKWARQVKCEEDVVRELENHAA
jgi:hypothetical protein